MATQQKKPSSQKADARPIVFALHDTVRNTPQEIFQLNIRPEELSRSDASRMTVHQTLAGAWADSFGPGIPTVTINGTTGWRGQINAGGLDGAELFKKLHSTVFARWHALRDEVVREGKDPDGIKLIFSDGLDDFTWAVAPQNFTLKRSRSRPLLSQYQITISKLADAVVEQPSSRDGVSSDLGAGGLTSLDQSIARINDFAKSIKGPLASALGPLKGSIESMVDQTSSALSDVRALSQAGLGATREVAGPVLEIAGGLTKVAVNVMNMVGAGVDMGQGAKSTVMGAKSAFQNAFCLLRNTFNAGGYLPNYDSLFGSSNCSSTAGGRPPSPFINDNVFAKIFPAQGKAVAVSAEAERAMNILNGMDSLKAAENLPQVGGLLSSINNGVSVSKGVIDSAIASASAKNQVGGGLGYIV